MSEIVSIQGLKKSYWLEGKEVPVLKGVDLTIAKGERISIIGRSGSGKSTFLHVLGTLDYPSFGRVSYSGRDIFSLAPADLAAFRNRTIGFVFQFHHLLPEFNALENLMLPGLIQGRSKKEMEKRAAALLEEVGLSPRATHRPGELSGGEQQRVAIARALVLGPKLLLADEPTGNLDTTTSESIHDLFFQINKEHGTTIVVVTHNPGFAESMPRVVRMVDGRVFKDDAGTRARQLSKPEGEPSDVAPPAEG